MTKFSQLDCGGIVRLMDSGFTLVQSLEILKEKNTSVVIEKLINEFESGGFVDDVFSSALNKDMRMYFQSFIQFVPFNQALSLSLELVEYDNNTRKKLIKNIFKPLCLFLGSLLAVQLFSVYCFPILINLMSDFNLDTSSLNIISKSLSVGINLFLICLLMQLIIIFVFSSRKRIVLGYILLCYSPWHKTVRKFLSGQFAYYFNECSKMGYKTQKTITIIQSMKQKPLIVFIAYHVEQGLLNGEKMEDAIRHRYLDTSLQKFIKIAIYSSSLTKMLDSYIEQNNYAIDALCKKWTKRITLFSYSSVGLLIIMIYQILLLPLTIIQEM